jgi:hypothetical protein
MRHAIAVALLLLLPRVADADVWRWRDADGRLHYSDARARVPRSGVRLRTDIGLVSTAPLPRSSAAEVQATLETYDRLHLARRMLGRLADLDAFYDAVRARQAARLLYFGRTNAFLLPDWAVADQWMTARVEEQWLWSALAELEARKPPGY